MLKIKRTIAADGADRYLRPARDVGGFEEHGNDHGRSRGPVGDPISARLDPGLPLSRDQRIWTRRREPRGRIALNFSFGFGQCGEKSASSLRPPRVFVVMHKSPDMTYRSGCVFDQRRDRTLRGGAASCLASIRAMLSSNICRTTSPGTVSPEAISASLSSRISSQPAGAMIGLSSMG